MLSRAAPPAEVDSYNCQPSVPSLAPTGVQTTTPLGITETPDGDFNGDGFSDVLFQNTNNGQSAIWEMDGSALVGGGTVSLNPGPTWVPIGTGDFNSDGYSDILWQSASGQAAIWNMNGSTLIGGGTIGLNAGPSWKTIGLT
jgi:FG-GAP-like repeat